VGLPNETLEEAEPEQGHAGHPFACPSPNVKRQRTCLAESKQMLAATTNPRDGGAIGSRSSVEKNVDRDEMTSSSAPADSYPDQEEEVVQQEAKKRNKIPAGWKCVKLEPDC
jgi:hypothetical protein